MRSAEENALSRLEKLRIASGELANLRAFVHPLLRPHLDGVVEFASTWRPELAVDPSDTYYATQYRMEEAAYLSAVQSALIYNRAACLGGMAVFYEAFRQARHDKIISHSASGIADLSDGIWDEFNDALKTTRA